LYGNAVPALNTPVRECSEVAHPGRFGGISQVAVGWGGAGFRDGSTVLLEPAEDAHPPLVSQF
jgi:hypothetical protein